MAKQAIIIYGPPGAGKGTQAELLERTFDFVHFDSGHYIESLVHSPESKTNKVLARERKLFDSGKLCTPSWVLSITKTKMKKVGAAGYNIAFSGAPRTTDEAFGLGMKAEGLIPSLAREYGKKNVTVVWLKVKDGTSLERNSARFVCSVCGLPVLGMVKVDHCAFCAGPLRKRTLDDPEVIKTRLVEYANRTYPIVQEMKRQKFRVIEVNGDPLPYLVFEEIKKKLHLK